MPTRADLFVPEDEDPRPEPPRSGDEIETLTTFLSWQRETVALKCDGLDPEQLARRAMPPSTMSLLGLVRHSADVERSWFRRVMAGGDDPPIFYSKEAPDDDWDQAVGTQECVDEAFAAWRTEIGFAERFVDEAASLDVLARGGDPDDRFNLRWVLVHLIEEYARHVGHADILREQIDGRLGQ